MYYPADFYLLRSPRFQLAKLLLLNVEIEQRNIDGIKNIFGEDDFLNAIYFSSRQFYAIASDWLENKCIEFDLQDRVLLSLYKYYVRICSRSTPYGIFAGFSFGEINQEPSSIHFDEVTYEAKFRVDFDALRKVRRLSLNIGKSEFLYANNTIYSVGDRLRYVDWDKDFNYQISEIGYNELLQNILLVSRTGVRADDVIDVIRKEVPACEPMDAKHFLESLITNKILVNNAPPYILSNKNPLNELIDYLEQKNDNTDVLKSLKLMLKESVKKIDVRKIEKHCQSLSNVLGDNDQLFQVDLKINLQKNQIHRNITQKLIDDSIELSALGSINYFKRLNEFQVKFLERFEGQEIPLIEAMDHEIGVGYEKQTSGDIEYTPLLDSVFLPSKISSESIKIPPLLKLVLDKYSHYLNPKANLPIFLSQKDVEQVSKNRIDPKQIPESAYLVGSIIAPSLKEMDNGNFKFYSTSSLPVPFVGRILSRFTYYDDNVHNKVKKSIVNDDENVINAEIAHDPEGRISNIMMRSNLFSYQIPYVSPHDSDIKTIPIEDIMVGIHENEIYLRSKQLKKRIRPHLSSSFMHNQSTLPVFRFLCDFQLHSTYLGYSWDWSFMHDNLYLPRVEYKNIILSQARWKVEKDDSYSLTSLKEKLQKHRVPRYCNIKDGDNVLLLDLDNRVSLQLILNRVVKRDIYLFEDLNHNLYVQESNMGLGYTMEFILPFIKRTHPSTRTFNNNENTYDDIDVRRSFIPGDTWSYFKLYCACSVGDRVLSILKNSIVDRLAAEGKQLFFFFVRFSDPDSHIRFRVKHVDLAWLLQTINHELEVLIESHLVSSVKIDTYHRELERYGSRNMELSELLFYADSLAVIKFISILPKNNTETLRWKVAIACIDMLLDDFNVPIEMRIELFKGSYNSFEQEFVDLNRISSLKMFRDSINKKLRKERAWLDSITREKKYRELDAFLAPFKYRSFLVSEISEEIKRNIGVNPTFSNLLRSYIHMSVNRMFPTKARKHELVLYYFLYQSYTSIYKRYEKK